MSQRSELRLFLVAGEASGDAYAASLVRELRALHPALRVFGAGGARLAREGADLLVDARKVSAVGATDWWDRAGEILRGFGRLKRAAETEPIDLAVLIDLPEINLRLAKRLKRRGVPIIYYVSPQVWAWRRYRVHQIRQRVDRMLVVFPFEEKFYSSHGVEASFVGHPLVETVERRQELRGQAEVRAGARVAVLPGSRPSELRHHAPLLRETAARLREEGRVVEFRAPVAETLDENEVREALGPAISLVTGPRAARDVLAWADVAAVASGTATLETALVGTPFVLFYRVTPTSAWIFRHFVRYRGHIGMPNVLLGREVAPELFQQAATPERLAAAVARLLDDESARREQWLRFGDLRDTLGGPGASRRAAIETIRAALPAPPGEVTSATPPP